jgi:XTP/dITP diphosphohydrolase
VDALNGEPGVYTARYGGPGLTIPQRYQLVLDKLRDVPWEQRTAHFTCALALAGPDGTLIGTVEGRCDGLIAWEPGGDRGFGYDPIFYFPERGQTYAQLSAAEKHQISHRGRALRAIQPLLYRVLANAA